MREKQRVREKVWRKLREVARPNSRFHWNFAEFIPDYEGSELCAKKIREMERYKGASFLFITPDNNLTALREYAIRDGKTTLMPTYGIVRGFLVISREDVPEGQERFAATLDGMDCFAKPIGIPELAKKESIDLLVTGASLINLQGVRWGKGHGYFDLEWAMMREMGLVGEETLIIAVGHDCQVVDIELQPSPFDTVVDRIVTPTQVIDIERRFPKPRGIIWERLEREMIEQIPSLVELRAQRRRSRRR